MLGANIVTNPGFEDNNGTTAGGWPVNDYYNRTVCSPVANTHPDQCGNPYVTFYGDASNAPVVALDHTVAHTGQTSVVMTRTSGGAEPMIDAAISPRGPRTYTLTFWARTTGPVSGTTPATVRARVAFVRDFYGADAWMIPNDGQWHQTLGSTYVPQSQSNVQLGLRDATAGQPVWFDDVALQELPFNVFPASLGTQQTGVNEATFRIQAVAGVPAGLTFSLDVTDPSGATTTRRVTLPAIPAGQDSLVAVPYTTALPGRYYLDPSILDGDQTVWHVVQALKAQNDPFVGDAVPAGYPNLIFTLAADTLSTSLVEPHYRAAIYATDPVSNVVVQGDVVAPAGTALDTYRYSAQLTDSAGHVLATVPATMPAGRRFTVSFPAGLLPAVGSPAPGQLYAADSYTVTVTLNDGQGRTYTSAQGFRKLGPSPEGVETVRDAHNAVLVNGQPFFPHGVYRADDLLSLQTGHFNLSFWDPTFPHALPEVGGYTYTQEIKQDVHYIVDLTPSNPVDPFTRQPFALNNGQTGAVCKYDYVEPVTCMDTYLQTMLAALRADPQVIGYGFEDEWLYDRYIQHAYDYVVAHDPYRIFYETAHVPLDYINIWHAADVVAVDPYPIAPTVTRSVLEVSRQLDEARQGIGARATLWLVPQVFAGLPAWLPPSTGQERAMYYLGLLHGATGEYGYAAYSGEIYPMPASCQAWPGEAAVETVGPAGAYLFHWHLWCTDLWPLFIQLGEEGKVLLPALTYGQNTAGDWSIQTGRTTSLDTAIRSYNGQTYIVAQNTDTAPAQETFAPKLGTGCDTLSATELFTGAPWGSAGGPVSAADGSLTISLTGYQTRVFTVACSTTPVEPPAATPELGSGDLLATGLAPIVAALLYRRRRKQA